MSKVLLEVCYAASTTVTLHPVWASRMAADTPLGPDPTTMASASGMLSNRKVLKA